MESRFAKETAEAGSQRLWMCPLVDTEQRGQEMVFKRYLGEKTDLTKDHKWQEKERFLPGGMR